MDTNTCVGILRILEHMFVSGLSAGQEKLFLV